MMRKFKSKADGMNKRILTWHCLSCDARFSISKPKVCTACGHKVLAFFPSKAEANRYADLRLQERAGLIVGLTLQPSFAIRSRRDDKVVLFTYRADFQYTRNGAQVIEDVKGLETDVFRLKKTLVEDHHDIKITIVKAR